MDHRPWPVNCYRQDMDRNGNNSNHNRPDEIRQAGTEKNTVRSLDEVAAMLGLSRQRVHDIETRAFKKLRRAFAQQMAYLELQHDEQGMICGLKELDHSSVT